MQDGALACTVIKNGVALLESSPIDTVLEHVDLNQGLKAASYANGAIDESYTIPAFKKSLCLDQCNMLSVELVRDGYPLTLEARAYNDGTAFRMPKANKALYTMRFRFSYEDELNPVPQEDLQQNL